jgi:hypothetical protein
VRIADIALLIDQELDRAYAMHASMPTAHHGISVMSEEGAELRTLVYEGEGREYGPEAEAECVQIAATAIRYILDAIRGDREHR